MVNTERSPTIVPTPATLRLTFMGCPFGGNRSMVATTASHERLAIKGAQCAHQSVTTDYNAQLAVVTPRYQNGAPSAILRKWAKIEIEHWQNKFSDCLFHVI